MNSTPPEVTCGRRTLLLIAALFLLPLAAAFWMYYSGSQVRPAAATQRGDLIDPARPLPDVTPNIVSGAGTGAALLRDQWSMVYVGDGRCDERCRQALYLMRQTRIALNKDAGRVRRVFLVTANCCDRAWLDAEHPDIVVARADDAKGRQLLAAFPSYGAGPSQAGRIWLVDPLGNLLLSYAPGSPDKALLEDLKRLLKLSHIG
jgi:cytochrome oxidase Cu insertion factor (SCO1/SenC/PrrC family)